MIRILGSLTGILLSILAAATTGSRAGDKEDPPPAPVKQPVVFSHSRHAKVGLNGKPPLESPVTLLGFPQGGGLNCHQDADPASDAFRSLSNMGMNERSNG
jgi:hypothetical protein